MSHAKKRHYRVARRDKEVMDETIGLLPENVQKLTILAIIVYIFTALISFSLGYVIGKNE